jgi:hypothetical protein
MVNARSFIGMTSAASAAQQWQEAEMAQGFGDMLAAGNTRLSGDIYGFKKHTSAEWKVYSSREQVSAGVLDYAFTLPPPGVPVINHRTGEEVSRAQVWRTEEMPPDMRDDRMTRTASIAARKEALEQYDSLKAGILSQIEDETRTRGDLAEKLTELPMDEDNRAMRELLTEYVSRLDRSLRQARDRLENLEAEYGPDGKYRQNICPDDEIFAYSGEIYDENMLINLWRAETPEDIIARATALTKNLTDKMEGLPSDAAGKLRQELDHYIWNVKDCIAAAKDRLKEEFGWTDEDITAALNAAATPGNPALVNELGDTEAPTPDEAFLQAAAEHRERQIAAGAGQDLFDKLNQLLKTIDQATGAMRARMQPLPDHERHYDVQASNAYYANLAASQSPPATSHAANPALINELAEAAE